ncbi:uncharacterized protein LOC100370300 [Saccoglossus kowalevskii]|uniref:Homeobox protein BarH-like 2-like n=1 Tax=Saccoglossus kowalevskii TaxID=10224 RepID=A0A0U2SRA3_SACKO|nr:PREDICTED: homeobox protein BarH-like 2-like [Saccoglossus kowalevskii]ALR88658.1 homeobox protein brain-specific-like 217 [Saccoglossus kowalevskii]
MQIATLRGANCGLRKTTVAGIRGNQFHHSTLRVPTLRRAMSKFHHISKLAISENRSSLKIDLPSPTSSICSDVGYGSEEVEGGISPPIVEHAERNRTCRRKKSRTAFSDEILLQLEKKFRQQKYLMADEREEFGKLIGLNETQVRTWFQNRRMRWKKQRKVTAEEIPTPRKETTRPSSTASPAPVVTSSPEKVANCSSDEPQPMTTMKLPTTPTILPSSCILPSVYSPSHFMPTPYASSAPYYRSYYPVPTMYSVPPYFSSYGGYPGMTRNFGAVIAHQYPLSNSAFVGQYSLTYRTY